jgi:hypothetical protein
VQQLPQAARVRQIAKMQKKPITMFVKIGENPVDTPSVETARPALDAMYLVTLPEQKLR